LLVAINNSSIVSLFSVSIFLLILLSLFVYAYMMQDIIVNNIRLVKAAGPQAIAIKAIVEPLPLEISAMLPADAMLRARLWFISFSILQLVETIILIVFFGFPAFFCVPFVVFIIYGILAFSSPTVMNLSAAYAAVTYAFVLNFVGIFLAIFLFSTAAVVGASLGIVITTIVLAVICVIAKSILLFFCKRGFKVWLMLLLGSGAGSTMPTQTSAGNATGAPSPPPASSDSTVLKS